MYRFHGKGAPGAQKCPQSSAFITQHSLCKINQTTIVYLSLILITATPTPFTSKQQNTHSPAINNETHFNSDGNNEI